MRSTVTHLVFDGVADGPLGVALDIVGTAARLVGPGRGRELRQRVVSVEGRDVTTAAGRRFAVDGAFRPGALGRGDVVVVAGLGLATPRALEAGLRRADVVRGIAGLARAHGRGVLLGASCSATFLLGAAGVLDGHEATTTWWLGTHFAQRFPAVSLAADRMVVRAGRVFTAGSSLAHADLLLAIVAHLRGPTLAHTVAGYLVLDRRPSQARYMVLDHVQQSDPVVRKLEAFVTKNLDRQVTLEEMARATATSPRTLARRVSAALATTPQRFAQRLRIAHAAHLLETTTQAVEEVAAEVGYADAAAFRRIFRRELGENPRERRGRVRTRDVTGGGIRARLGGGGAA